MKLAYGLSLLFLSSPHVASYDNIDYKHVNAPPKAPSYQPQPTDSSAFKRHKTPSTRTFPEQQAIFLQEFLPDALEKLRLAIPEKKVSRGERLSHDLKILTHVGKLYLTHYKHSPALKQMIDRLLSDIRLAASKEIVPTPQKIYQLLPPATQEEFRTGVRVILPKALQATTPHISPRLSTVAYHTGDILLYTLQEVSHHFGTCTTRTKCLEEDQNTIRRVIRMLSEEDPARLQLGRLLRDLKKAEEKPFDSYTFLQYYQKGKLLIDAERLNWKSSTQNIRLLTERPIREMSPLETTGPAPTVTEEEQAPPKKRGTIDTLKDDFKDSIEEKGKQLIDGFLDSLVSS